MKQTLTIAAVLAAVMTGGSSANAADSCGYFAFAGAFNSFNKADRKASRIGGNAWGLDSSDSPNAGKGLWVVAKGPGSKPQANQWRHEYVRNGVRDAYVARRCFFGE